MDLISRMEAKNLGLKRFFSGNACPKGHVCERLTSNGTCIQCSKERLKKWSIDKQKKKRNNLQKLHQRVIVLRGEALELGLKRYFTGVECPKCLEVHERRTSDSKCMKCVREKNRKRRKENPEYFKDCINKFHKRNPKAKAVSHNNRRKAVGKISIDQINAAINKQNNKCTYCKGDFSEVGMHIDHYVPISKGGWNLICNIQCLCPTCNLKKGAKDPKEFEGEMNNEH